MPLLRKKAEDAASALPALMIKAERAAQNILHGEHAQKKSGAGEKFWQFREYQSQDRPQDIDWKQSGKTDRVFIRQKERQLPQTALFWCSGAAGMAFSSAKLPTKQETAQVVTLALAILMSHAGERFGLLGETQTGRSEHTLEYIGNGVTQGLNHDVLPKAAPARTQKNAMMILTGDFLSLAEDIETNFKNVAGQAGGGIVIQILDPAEIELPWQGRAVFEDSNRVQREIVQNIPSIRAEYKKRIENHIAAVEQIAKGCGWDYVLHRTDEKVENTLINIWLLMNARGMR